MPEKSTERTGGGNETPSRGGGTPSGVQTTTRRVMCKENAWPRWGISVLRAPLFPDGSVTVVRLDLGITRYEWGEVK